MLDCSQPTNIDQPSSFWQDAMELAVSRPSKHDIRTQNDFDTILFVIRYAWRVITALVHT
jgi:hypothetical protein